MGFACLGSKISCRNSKLDCRVQRFTENLESIRNSATFNSARSVYVENPECFFEISIDGEKIGRLEIELRKDIVPRTADNFRALCTGEYGYGYKGCRFYRVYEGRCCVCGDIENNDGTGEGKSIYGRPFNDESFRLNHTGRGILTMANSGMSDNNTSKFYIMFTEKENMDNHNVVFGKVIAGMDVLKAIERLGSTGGETKSIITISDCGEILD